MQRPIIGITASTDGRDAVVRLAYGEAVARAGGMGIVLAPPGKDGTDDGATTGDERGLVSALVASLDGLMLTGGDDPIMEAFGGTTDPRVTPVHPERQRFELLLLETAERERPGLPVLGVCLGMQLMCLRAGYVLDQWLADSLGEEGARRHHPGPAHADAVDERIDTVHGLVVEPGGADLLGGARETNVISWHRQGVREELGRSTPVRSGEQDLGETGALSVIARSDDGLVEAVRDESRAWCVGVQWHPERTGAGELGDGLIGRFVGAAEGRRTVR